MADVVYGGQSVTFGSENIVVDVPEASSVVAFVVENYADSGTITASSTSGSMAAALLKNQMVARKWRAASNTTYLLIDLGAVKSIDTIVLGGLNLTAGGTVRVRMSATNSSATSAIAWDGYAEPMIRPALSMHVWIKAAPVSARYVRIDLADTSLSWVEAGRLVIGARRHMTINMDWGWSKGREDLSKITQTAGGQSLIDKRGSRRTMSLTLSNLTDAEADWWHDIDATVGLTGDMLFLFDAAYADLPSVSIWGRMDALEPIANPYLETYSRSVKIIERM